MAESAHFAEVEAVRQYASTLSAQQLQCRDFGHNWRPHTAARRSDGGFERSLICKCRTLRIQILDSYGRVVSSQYAYAEGYQMPRGIGRVSSDDRGVLRLASIEHTLAASEQKQPRKTAAKKTAARKSTGTSRRTSAQKTTASAASRAPGTGRARRTGKAAR